MFSSFTCPLDRRSLPFSSTAQNIQNDTSCDYARPRLSGKRNNVCDLDPLIPNMDNGSMGRSYGKEMPLRYQLLNLQEKPNVIYCHFCRRSHKKIKGSIFVGYVSVSLMARECRGGFCAPIQCNYFGLSVALKFKKLQRSGRLDWHI